MNFNGYICVNAKKNFGNMNTKFLQERQNVKTFRRLINDIYILLKW